METVSNIQELVRFIGASSSKNSVLVEIRTWDRRVVRGSNYGGSKRADVISVATLRMDSNLLWPHVRSLVETGEGFIIRIGPNCDACLSEWTISDN